MTAGGAGWVPHPDPPPWAPGAPALFAPPGTVPLLVLLGPTAVGKTAAGIALARRLAGEVISGDSAMVYRGMDIGTAKPTPAERQGVPHHLIDVCDPGDVFTVAAFQEAVWRLAPDIWGRGRLPLLVGGTALYLNAALGRYTFPRGEPDWEIRNRLAAEAARAGAAALHARLAEVDPVAAARIHPNDRRRIIRALEVYETTGRPLSETWGRRSPGRPDWDALVVGIEMPREILRERIRRRVDQQLAQGLLDEVRRLWEAGYGERHFALRALGYRQLLPVVRGERPLEEGVRLLVRDTRRFMKRQGTWWRHDPDIVWVRADPDRPERAVATIGALAAGKWCRPMEG